MPLRRPATLRGVLALSMVVSAACAAPSPVPDQALAEAVRAFAAPYAEGGNFSGVILVAREGRDPLTFSFGSADPERGTTPGPRTRFRVGSITKSFTAAAVLRLRDRGEIELDRPVSTYIVDFPHGDSITVRQLLQHRSGLPNYFFLPDFQTLAARHYPGPAEVVEIVRGLPLQSAPGERYAYNNVNYVALGWLIETISGQTYDSFLRRTLLDPLELVDTGEIEGGADTEAGDPNLARGLEPVGSDSLAPIGDREASYLVAAGSLGSTAGDLARWLRGIDRGEVVTGRSRDELIDLARLDDEVLGRPALSTGGWDGIGFAGFVVRVPSDSLDVVVLSNVNMAGVTTEIARGVAALALGGEPTAVPLHPRALLADSLDAFAGTYAFGPDFYVPGGRLELVAREGHLFDVGRDPDAALLELADGTFLYRPTWARVRFVRGDDGRVTGLEFEERFRAERVGGRTTP